MKNPFPFLAAPVWQLGLTCTALGLLSLACSSTETQEETEPALKPAAASAGSLEPTELLPDQDPIQEARSVQELREQKNALLVENYLRQARQAMADGRYVDAENQLIAAWQLDPGNREVTGLLNQVGIALGRETDYYELSTENLREITQARIQKIMAETEAHAERGFQLLSDGEYDEAIGALRLAKANIEGTPFQVDWGDLPVRVDGALAQAQAERDLAQAQEREREKQETFEALKREEEQMRREQEMRLERMLSDAIEAFDQDDFETVEDLTAEILRLQPLNERARELRDTAWKARHQRIAEERLELRKERFKLWQEDIEETRVLLTETLTMPDKDYWDRITELRSHYTDLGLGEEESPENLALRAEVQKQRIPGLQLDGETSLQAVMDQIRANTDIPFVVTPAAVEAVDAEGIEFTLNLTNPLTVEQALNVVTEQAGPEVTYTFRHGVVYITTAADALGGLVQKAHDVQDLTAQVVDFAGPKIAEIQLPDSQSSFGDEEPLFGGVTGELTSLINPDNLETQIQESIAPETWSEVEGVSIRYQNGFLVVNHTPEVQREIARFLQDLRRYISSMVTIEARFLTIQKDFLQEMGVDFRGLGGTFSPPTDLVTLDDITSGLEDAASAGLDNDGAGLQSGAEASPSAGAFFDDGEDGDIRARTENILGSYGTERLSPVGGLSMQFTFLDDTQLSMILRAVEKSNKAQMLTSTTLSAQNTQRAFITVLNQITYVQDMDVEVAQAAIIADPQVGVVNDGIVLDVRPTISHDRQKITLELRPTVATLLRPIPEFTSSLAGLTTPVTLQLPELQVSSANTTVTVPDGGTVVIAGLKKLLNIEQRAEVPFLAKIPVLSLLFKAEGEANENQDVIILIRAQITDALEEAAKMDRSF